MVRVAYTGNKKLRLAMPRPFSCCVEIYSGWWKSIHEAYV